MNTWAAYLVATGEITKVMTMPDDSVDGNLSGSEVKMIVPASTRTSMHYVVSGEVVARPDMPLTVSGLSVGIEEPVEISGVPAGTVLFHPDGTAVIDDGTVEWSSDVAGTFALTLEKFPYKRQVFHVQVHA